MDSIDLPFPALSSTSEIIPVVYKKSEEEKKKKKLLCYKE